MSNSASHAAAVAAAVSKMTPAGQAAVRKRLRVSERFSLWNKYYSKVRFQSIPAPGPPATFTFNVNNGLKAFSYNEGQDMAGVGFPPGTLATTADTNLIKQGETISGEKVIIYGLCCRLSEDSDTELAKVIWPNISVQIVMNGGQQTYKLGTVGMVPGGGGLTGFGTSYVVMPNQEQSVETRSGSMSNGDARPDNFYPFPQPIIWNPSGANDSTMVIKLTMERTTVYTVTGGGAQRPAVPGGATTPGTASWTAPTGTDIGTYVDIEVHLMSRQLSKRSVNS